MIVKLSFSLSNFRIIFSATTYIDDIGTQYVENNDFQNVGRAAIITALNRLIVSHPELFTGIAMNDVTERQAVLYCLEAGRNFFKNSKLPF